MPRPAVRTSRGNCRCTRRKGCRSLKISRYITRLHHSLDVAFTAGPEELAYTHGADDVIYATDLGALLSERYVGAEVHCLPEQRAALAATTVGSGSNTVRGPVVALCMPNANGGAAWVAAKRSDASADVAEIAVRSKSHATIRFRMHCNVQCMYQ